MRKDPNLFKEILDQRLRRRLAAYEGIELTEIICLSIRNECIEEVGKLFRDFREKPLTEEEKDELR